MSSDQSAHDQGTRKGEERGFNDEPGRPQDAAHPDDQAPGRTSRDATGINADKRAPIDPAMPEMPPA
jgi:hypothetical protein